MDAFVHVFVSEGRGSLGIGTASEMLCVLAGAVRSYSPKNKVSADVGGPSLLGCSSGTSKVPKTMDFVPDEWVSGPLFWVLWKHP